MSKFPKNETTKKAKSVNEAVELALAELGVTEDDVEITVIDEGAKGFLGLGAKEAEVKVTIKDVCALTAKSFLKSIFDAMKLDVDIATEPNEAGDGIDIDLSGENMGIIIGKRGDTLDSLQYLTSLVVNQQSEDYVKVSIDTENYREKRVEALTTLSERLALKVKKTGKKYTLEPMTPYERRIIHATLQNDEELVTYSIGEEPYRKVVIALKNPRPAYKKPQQRRDRAPRADRAPRTDKPRTDKPRDKKPYQKHDTAKKSSDYTPKTYKADYPRNQRPETKGYKSFDEYFAGHASGVGGVDIPEIKPED